MKKPTKKQHYVPQVYLRGFSTDEKMIMSYDVLCMSEPKLVPIKSICFENYLYEIKNDDGKMVYVNYLEKFLSKLESEYSNQLAKIIDKAKCVDNRDAKLIFDDEMRAFWKAFVLVQMLRHPQVLSEVLIGTKEYFGELLNDSQAHTLATLTCLPFFDDIDIAKEPDNVLVVIYNRIKDYDIAIGFDRTGSLFTSDNPIIWNATETDLMKQSEDDLIILPLTNEYLLIIFGSNTYVGGKQLFSIDEEKLNTVKALIASRAIKMIFAHHSFSNDELRIIEFARNKELV